MVSKTHRSRVKARSKAFPSEVLTPGRWIRSGRSDRRGSTTRSKDWSTYLLKPHQVAAKRADLGQKHDPGERMPH
jgi:hypothetical protein